MNKITFTLIALFLVPMLGLGQSDEPVPSKRDLRKNRTTYRGTSLLGLGTGSFRDFATSPLFYTGLSLSSSRFKISIDANRETEWGGSLTVGLFANNFNDHSSSSTVITPTLYYSELYALKRFSGDKLNVKVGGLLNITSNIRINQGLLNNAVGFEMIPTLFGSIKGTLDVSRKTNKDKKFLFLKSLVSGKTF